MFKLLNDTDIGYSAAAAILTAVVGSAVLYFTAGVTAAVICAAVCAAMLLLFFFTMRKRRKRVLDFTAELDRILHGDDIIRLSDYNEGELSVLFDEVSKLTVMLREKNEALERDKNYLADSLADISHQIKTPLTSVNLILVTLGSEQLTDERRLACTKELEMLLSRVEWQVSTLLKLSKLDAGRAYLDLRTVNAAELVSKAVALVEIPMELRGQTFTVRHDGEAYFNGDLAWSVEALGNILKNCMEHTPEGGCIEIRVTGGPLFTEITVRDNGSGIDEGDLPHIFERFYKGKNSGKGSVGIGLALTRKIISAQNGTVKAENNVNGGSLFTIRFYKSAV